MSYPPSAPDDGTTTARPATPNGVYSTLLNGLTEEDREHVFTALRRHRRPALLAAPRPAPGTDPR